MTLTKRKNGEIFVTNRDVTCRIATSGFSAYREGCNIDLSEQTELPFRCERCNARILYTRSMGRGVRIKLRIIGKRECGFVSKRRVGRKGAHRTYYLARSSIEWTETKGATEQNNADVQGTRN